MAFGSLGEAAFAHGLLDEQIADATRELKKFPGDRSLRLKRAELYRVHREFGKSRADLEILFGLKAPPAEAFYSLAILERDQGNVSDAAKAMESYLKLSADNPLAYREVATFYTKLDSKVKAAENWEFYFKKQRKERVTAIDVRDAAGVFLSTGRQEEARVLVDDWRKAFPHSIELTQISAKCFLAKEEDDRAADEFLKLKKKFPMLVPRLSLQEGKIYREFRKEKEAKEAWTRGLKVLDEKTTSRPGLEDLKKELVELLR